MRTLKLHQVLPEQKKKKKQGKRERKKTKFWPLKPQVQNVMSRNKTIMGENGFVGHFYWIGDDLNQVQNSNLLFEGQVWGKKMQHHRARVIHQNPLSWPAQLGVCKRSVKKTSHLDHLHITVSDQNKSFLLTVGNVKKVTYMCKQLYDDVFPLSGVCNVYVLLVSAGWLWELTGTLSSWPTW